MTPQPTHPIAVHIPANVFLALVEHTDEGWYGPKSEAALVAAVWSWIGAGKAAPTETKAVALKGYQWKKLFLPEGTALRAAFQGQVSYATVEGETIRCDGKSLSPSQFANLDGGGNRNAWRVIWLRLPGESTWKNAGELRDMPY